jgi:hypothetical protein
MKLLFLLVFAASLAFASCSSKNAAPPTSHATGETVADSHAASPTPTATKAPADEAAAAKQMLLTVADFPTGWAEQTSPLASNPVAKCESALPADAFVGAATGAFSSTGGVSAVTEELVIAKSGDAITARLQSLPARFDCFTQIVNAGEANTAQALLTAPSVSPLSFPPFGDHSEAYQLKVHTKIVGQTGPGSEGDLFLDLVYVVQGRVGVAIVGAAAVLPFDSATLTQTVKTAMSKVFQP